MKLSDDRYAARVSGSPPVREAWIETHSPLMLALLEVVASRAGGVD